MLEDLVVSGMKDALRYVALVLLLKLRSVINDHVPRDTRLILWIAGEADLPMSYRFVCVVDPHYLIRLVNPL
jgi:hypothetical protein